MKTDFVNKTHIAILGGTFNPVHKGHIYMAEKTLEAFPDVEQVYLMPNNLTAYKDNTVIASNEHRIRMLELACEGRKDLVISTLDIDRGGTTYTIDTLNEIKSINPDIKLDFIIGADSLFTFHKWLSYKDILGLCRLIVIRRDSQDDELHRFRERLKNANSNADIVFLNVPELRASSTQIRKSIKMGNYNIAELAENVLEYIIANKLYR